MKKFFAILGLAFLLAACGGQAHAASPAFVSDTIVVSQPQQGITGWAAIVTDLGSASAAINDATPTVISFVTAFAPDYSSTAKLYSVNLFLTQAGASAYLAAHPGATVGWYKPASHN